MAEQPVDTSQRDAEVAALVRQLKQIEEKLEALAAGAVDSVIGTTGTSHLFDNAPPQRVVSGRNSLELSATQNAVLNALPAQVALLNLEGAIVSVNQAWSDAALPNRLASAEYRVGLNYLRLCQDYAGEGAEDARRLALGIGAVLNGKEARFSFEYRCGSQTELHWFATTVTPLGQDPIEGAVVMHFDVSERKHAEAALGRTSELLNAVVSGTPDAVFVKDLNGRYLLCNEATARFLDRPIEEVIGKDDAALFGPDDARHVMRTDRLVMESGVVHSVEETLTSAGATRSFLATKAPYRDKSGEVVGVVGISREITDRKLAERERDRERELLRTLIDALPDVVYTMDTAGRYVICNPAARVACGVQRDMDVIGKTVFEVFSREHADRFHADDRQVLAGHAVWNREECGYAENGQPLWYLTTKVPLRDNGGEITGLVSISRNITEQKRSQEEAREIGTRLSTTLGSLTDGFYTLDRDWRFTYVNTEAERQMRHAPGELLGKVIWDAIPAFDSSPFAEPLRRAMGRETMVQFVDYYAQLHRWFDARIFPSPQGVAVYFRDVSEQRALAASLEQERARLVAAQAVAKVGSWETDLTSLEVNWSDETYRIFGLDPRVFRPTHESFLEYVHPDDRPAVDAAFHRSLQLQATQTIEHRVLLPNGEIKIVEERWDISRDQAGRPIRAFGTCQDITERKRDQEALRELNAKLESRVRARTAELSLARHEAEQASRAKSAFLATMSHEIRTPMNGVIGMIDVLHQTGLQGPQVEMVDLIRDSAFSLLRIIEDILDFSRIEAGKLNIENEPMHLDEVVEKVCGMMDHMAVSRDVRMAMFVDPRIPGTVLGDEVRLRQVLVNLISNAIKFSSGRSIPGEVSVRAVLVGRQADLATVNFVVTDNGIGIDPVAQARLFKPFSQADASTTRRFGGTGLGLAISGMLVQLMGGEIAVKSAADVGTRFTVSISFQTPTGTGAEEAFDAMVAGLHCRIVGGELPLPEDLATYLTHAGAVVERWPDLNSAMACAPASGEWLWVIMPGESLPPMDELRAQLCGQGQSVARFVVLGRGKTRRPRVDSVDLISIDADALSRRTFFKVLALASGRIQEDPAQAEVVPDRTPTAQPQRQNALLQGQSILVAEDNETNRTVIKHQLELIGYAAEFVNNGREALERWRDGKYALILTDLHMPEMDGYALAKAIRSEESASRHTPIIALTANALRDEERRCREAGMDGYLTKPVRLPQLAVALEEWMGPYTPTSIRSAEGLAASSGEPPADLKVLAAQIGHDPTTVAEVMQTFREGVERSRDALRQGVLAGSMRSVADAAHKLKSSARAIGASALGELCAEIESKAEAADVTGVEVIMQRFESELDAVNRYLDSV